MGVPTWDGLKTVPYRSDALPDGVGRALSLNFGGMPFMVFPYEGLGSLGRARPLWGCRRSAIR